MPSSIFLMRLVGLEAVVGGDALDADLGEARDVLVGDVAAEVFEEGLQAARGSPARTLSQVFDFSMWR
jgi:hypothetical protein